MLSNVGSGKYSEKFPAVRSGPSSSISHNSYTSINRA